MRILILVTGLLIHAELETGSTSRAETRAEARRARAKAAAEQAAGLHYAKWAGEGTTAQGACTDERAHCPAWAEAGECEASSVWMKRVCCKSCGPQVYDARKAKHCAGVSACYSGKTSTVLLLIPPTPPNYAGDAVPLVGAEWRMRFQPRVYVAAVSQRLHSAAQVNLVKRAAAASTVCTTISTRGYNTAERYSTTVRSAAMVHRLDGPDCREALTGLGLTSLTGR